jgi:hypothetical protein
MNNILVAPEYWEECEAIRNNDFEYFMLVGKWRKDGKRKYECRLEF